jgi:hypothetical protein
MDDLFGWAEKRESIVPLGEMRRIILESKEPCYACGCRSALNPMRIDKRKLQVLRDMVEMHKTDHWIRCEHGRMLKGLDTDSWVTSAYRAREHVSNLQNFGLAVTEGKRTSKWRITWAGVDFLRGATKAPVKILVRNGKTVYRSKEEITVFDVTDTFDKEYWDNYPLNEIFGDTELLTP